MRTTHFGQLLVCLIFLTINTYAQNVQWASRLLGFSSEFRGSDIGQEHHATQVLGKPNVTTAFGESPCAWSPANQDNNIEDWVKVGFESPQKARTIFIVENFNAGSVIQVYTYDDKGVEKLVYQNKETTPPKIKGRVLSVAVEDSNTTVAALKVVLNSSRVKGYSQIDAIGISKSRTPPTLGINVAKDAPSRIIKQSVGRGINSRAEEIAPVISPDARTLYFTRANHEQNKGSLRKQDVWYATADSRGNWSKALNIDTPINNAEHNGIVGISTDGRVMFLMNVYKADGMMTSGLSKTTKTRGQWEFPIECKIDDFQIIGEGAERKIEFSISPQRDVMVMSVKRNDTYGGRDLYVCFAKPDGSWTKPKNMGQTLNTADIESAPFIANDSKTLYFSSMGHSGFGNSDIFMTHRLDDSWTNWSEPENLGPAINTPKWDGYLQIPVNGEYGYMCSLRGKSTDIYRFKPYEEMKPSPVIIVGGTVLDADTRKPIKADVAITAQSTKKQFSKINYDPEDGDFKIILPVKDIYTLAATKEGYFTKEEQINVSKDQAYPEARLNILMIPVKVGQKMTLTNVLFEQSKSTLLESATEELNKLAKLMKDYPNMEILVEGHTDNQGEAALNMNLSEERVNEVKNYLVTKGIAPASIQTKAWGGTKPIANNDVEETRRRNRRVEFTIIKM